MSGFWRVAALCLLAALAQVAMAQTVMAQAVPPTQDIVDALKPPGGGGLSAAPPSLSLAIQFEPNSARVRPESGPVLGNLVAALLAPELQASRFVIEGHSDSRGPAAANLRLSQERADEVRLYLVALGVPASRLRAVGKGAGDPADAADPQAAANRRVRVVAVVE